MDAVCLQEDTLTDEDACCSRSICSSLSQASSLVVVFPRRV